MNELTDARGDAGASRATLYGDWRFYDRIFPVEHDDVRFFHTMLPERGTIADLGHGSGSLMARLADAPGRWIIGVDLAPSPIGIRGDLRTLPFADQSLDGAYSRLFSVSYAAASDDEGAGRVADELARVLKANAAAVLELPVAWRPQRLQGLEERWSEGEIQYRFRYLDVLSSTPYGVIIATLIEAKVGVEERVVDAPFHVFTPSGLEAWCDRAGLTPPTYHPAYELLMAEEEAPADILRAVIVCYRRGGGAAVPSTVLKG